MKAILFAVISLLIAPATYSQTSEVYQKDGVAINGYDVVAFFTKQAPTKGKAAFAHQWKNANWYFESQKNLDAFKAAPENYAPQYGGYCAFGTADGHKAPTEADTWTLVDGKLYFNYNIKVKSMWSKDTPAFIEKADKNWPAIKDSKM